MPKVSVKKQMNLLFGGEIVNTPVEVSWETSSTAKVGRQGYALILKQSIYGWHWDIESQNGAKIATSSRVYDRRWDAVRSAKRLVGDRLAHFYVEDDEGFRSTL